MYSFMSKEYFLLDIVLLWKLSSLLYYKNIDKCIYQMKTIDSDCKKLNVKIFTIFIDLSGRKQPTASKYIF